MQSLLGTLPLTSISPTGSTLLGWLEGCASRSPQALLEIAGPKRSLSTPFLPGLPGSQLASCLLSFPITSDLGLTLWPQAVACVSNFASP